MSDGFAIYSLDHPETARTSLLRIKAQLEKEIAELRMAKNWDDFKQRVGRISGLEGALQIIEMTAKDNDQRGSKDARKPATDR